MSATPPSPALPIPIASPSRLLRFSGPLRLLCSQFHVGTALQRAVRDPHGYSNSHGVKCPAQRCSPDDRSHSEQIPHISRKTSICYAADACTALQLGGELLSCLPKFSVAVIRNALVHLDSSPLCEPCRCLLQFSPHALPRITHAVVMPPVASAIMV